MARNPFDFLDSGSRERTLLLLLLALIRKQGGEVELSVTDLTSVGDGDSFLKYPADNGASLVLRFARRGAEAYFLAEEQSSTPVKSRSTPRTATPPAPADEAPLPSPRHAIHDDLDLALQEEQMAEKAARLQRDRLNRERAASGALPWRTRPQ